MHAQASDSFVSLCVRLHLSVFVWALEMACTVACSFACVASVPSENQA